MGLAALVHPCPLLWASGHAFPRTPSLVSREKRCGRLSRSLRGALRAAGTNRYQGGRTLQGRAQLRHCGRRATVRGRQRGGSNGRLPGPEDTRLRGAAGSLDPATGFDRVPESIPAAGGWCPGRGRRQLGGRDRPRGVPYSPDLAFGQGHRARPHPYRDMVGPAAHAALLVLRLARAHYENADRTEGSAESPDHRRATRTGEAEGARHRRDRARTENHRRARRVTVLGGRSRHGGVERDLVHGFPARLRVDRPSDLRRERRTDARTGRRGERARSVLRGPVLPVRVHLLADRWCGQGRRVHRAAPRLAPAERPIAGLRGRREAQMTFTLGKINPNILRAEVALWDAIPLLSSLMIDT